MSDTISASGVTAGTLQFLQSASSGDPFAGFLPTLAALGADPVSQITLSDINGTVSFAYNSTDPNAIVTQTTVGGVTTVTFDAHSGTILGSLNT